MNHKRALLIIDVQNDFCEGGSLAVHGGKSVVGPINDLISSEHWDLVVASKDWHPQNHVSFASNHSGKEPFEQYRIQSKDAKASYESTLWPDHCVQNTQGADLVDGLNLSRVDAIVLKGEDPSVEFYSAFQDMFKAHSTNLLQLLRESEIAEVVVVGLAMDFCVMHTAIDAADAGFATSINLACTKPISKEGEAAAKTKLEAAGVHLVK